jgi:hypothetical protein
MSMAVKRCPTNGGTAISATACGQTCAARAERHSTYLKDLSEVRVSWSESTIPAAVVDPRRGPPPARVATRDVPARPTSDCRCVPARVTSRVVVVFVIVASSLCALCVNGKSKWVGVVRWCSSDVLCLCSPPPPARWSRVAMARVSRLIEKPFRCSAGPRPPLIASSRVGATRCVLPAASLLAVVARAPSPAASPAASPASSVIVPPVGCVRPRRRAPLRAPAAPCSRINVGKKKEEEEERGVKLVAAGGARVARGAAYAARRARSSTAL